MTFTTVKNMYERKILLTYRKDIIFASLDTPRKFENIFIILNSHFKVNDSLNDIYRIIIYSLSRHCSFLLQASSYSFWPLDIECNPSQLFIMVKAGSSQAVRS